MGSINDGHKQPEYRIIKDKINLYLKDNLKEKRIKHVKSVVSEAIKLAIHYDENPEKAEIAALFHDMFRSKSVSVLNMYVKHLGLPENIMENPNLSHGKIAAEIMHRDYGIDDMDIINAVSFHTTGRAGMSKLEKIIFIADAIEEGRNYPGVEEMRLLAYKDLDRACISSLENTVNYVLTKGEFLHPDTLSALNYLKENLK